MQFENDGILIWYGTSDAPAPDGSVLEGTEAKIIVGVQPQDASNFIEVRYRVNGGSTQTVAAKFFRNDPLRQVQYFRAYLPPFQAGDRIEYTVICRCAGRQVPPRTDEEQRADSFQVVSAPREEILASNPELADTEQSQNGDQFQSEESQSEKFQPEEIATKINISNSNNVNRDIQEDIPVFSSTKSESISQGSVVAQAVPPKVSTIKISDDRLNSFYNQNPDFDILKFNLLNGQTKNLNWDNIERETTLDLLKKYQRLLRINPNPEIAKKLLNAPSQSELNIQSRSASQDQPSAAPLRFPSEEGLGVGSAHAIASMTEEQFVKMLPGDEAVARQMHKNAVGIKAKTQILWANMRDAVASPHFRSMRVSTTQESDRAALEQNIPSYQEMFGDLDYIDCEHCGSIFSPAAYFVDLMRIVDQYITEPNQDSIRQAGGLTLGDRRPDLAQIKLTCENTNTSIPSLQIINRILEARVGLQSLATAKYPFNLPFHFPLEQIRSYLGHLKTDLGTIYQTFDVNELAIAREYIGLSLEEYNLITNPETKEEELKKLYGIKEEELDSLNNVETFLKQTGLSRTELPELLEQNLHQDELDAGLAHNFYINQVLESDRAVQIKIENLMQLVGYWPMNEVNENEAGEKVVIPDRAGNNNGTLQGNPQWKIVNDFPGVESRSVLEFDGEGDYVEFASENASFGQFEKSNFSIGLWFKTKESSGTLMMGAGSRVDYWRIYLEEGFAKFGFETQGLSGDDGSSNATVNEGKWHHLTAIRDGVRSGKLYLDGVLVDEFNYSGNNVSIEEVSTVFIGKDDKTDYFQGQIAEVRIWNGTTSPLDRINRFIRLAKKLNWSFSDLDWVLTSIETSEIDEEAIKKIAKIKQLQAKYKLPLDVLCSFWHEMKTIGIGSNSKKPQDLFDRVFNNPFQEILGNNFFPIQDEIKQIELNNLDREAEINPIVGRILAALRLNFNQLIDIFPAIWGQEGTVELTVENLSQLFRISQILRLLGLNIEEYQVLLSFLDIESISSLSIDQFIQITELAEWVKESKFKIDELDYIITGKLSSNFDIGYSETDITGGMKSLWQLAVDSLLKPSDFIGEEIDEQKSVDIFEQLLKSHYIKEVTSEYKEVLNISLEEKCAIIIAPNLSDDQEIVREINQIINHQNEGNVNDKNQREETQLSPEIQHLQEILQKADDRQGEQLKEMASFFGIEADLAFSLLYFGSVRFQEKEQQQDIPTSAIPTTDYVKQLLLIPVQKEQEWSEIVKFFQFLSRILILTQKLELTPTELKCIADNQTAFGINKPSEEASFQLTISNIQTIARFKKLIQAFNDDKDKLVEYFTPVSENGESVSEKHQNNPIEGLAEITGWKSEQIEQLVPLLSSAGNKKNNQLNDLHKTVEGITKLQECFNLSRHLGVNISWFNKLLNLKNLPVVGEKVIEGETIANWELYQNAAQAVKEITKAKYDDEEWVKVSEKLEGELNERKRDVLTAWILGQNKYENLRHLSQELLIDVETSSEVSVSIIKEATLAIQTYFHRCRMGLEPGVKKLDIPEIWWQWMMNYRVWEANRKVFLYPENYLDPSLRKIKSPIYKELEEELLQSEITQESVEKAYQNYFEKFAEIAQLKPAGGYRCTVDNNSGAQDTLYLFGRTATEPYTYYYRECINPAANNPTWKAWEKIDLVINSEQINATYAFNKLFIFWVEVITIENKENPDSDPKKETKATIKYSFQKFGKQWMQPQTLAKDIVIKVEDYNENKNLWRKVTALPIPANDSEPQKILTLFGDVKEEKEVQGITLTIDLLQEDSTIKLQDLQDQSFKFIRSLIEGSRLKVKATNNVLYDNYVDDYKDANNISLEHPEQVLIKSNISAYASARMIKNQPEWFTFDNGDEAFLVIPKPQTNQAKKNRKIRTLQGHDSSVRGVSFSPDGTILASGSTDRTIKLWNVETGQEIRTLQGHTDDVRSVSFSPDGTILASGSTDRTIKLWNVETGQEIRTLQGHTD
nr:neuraminidase-like domain-containing protein [Xenococcus sp. MO_188.B8]